jgi:hypothetical protein
MARDLLWSLLLSSTFAFAQGKPHHITNPLNTVYTVQDPSLATSDGTLQARQEPVPASPKATPEVWQPKVGAKFQIVLDKKIIQLDSKTELVPDADIWDVDLFHTPEKVIRELKSRGKHVICYFSAGGTETWRPDNNDFKPEDIGKDMRGWKGENWLDIRSSAVWTVMEKRIKMAADKGCSGIDPDNLGMFCLQHSVRIATGN